MATLGERIKPSLKQSNPIAFENYPYGGSAKAEYTQDAINNIYLTQEEYDAINNDSNLTQA